MENRKKTNEKHAKFILSSLLYFFVSKAGAKKEKKNKILFFISI